MAYVPGSSTFYADHVTNDRRRWRVVRFPADLFVCMGRAHVDLQSDKALAEGLPADARVDGIRVDEMSCCVDVRIWSSTFSPVPECGEVPPLELTWRRRTFEEEYRETYLAYKRLQARRLGLDWSEAELERMWQTHAETDALIRGTAGDAEAPEASDTALAEKVRRNFAANNYGLSPLAKVLPALQALEAIRRASLPAAPPPPSEPDDKVGPSVVVGGS